MTDSSKFARAFPFVLVYQRNEARRVARPPRAFDRAAWLRAMRAHPSGRHGEVS